MKQGKMRYRIWIYVIGILMGISCQRKAFQSDILHMLNIEAKEIKLLDSYHQFGGFGEGFIVEEYSVSPKVVTDFLYPTAKIIPRKNETHSWQKIDWKQGPPSEYLEELFLLCLSYEDGNEIRTEKLKELRQLVESPWVYYAFYYYPSLEMPELAQMFILDSRTKKIYAIEISI
ncbi:hypothetical protein [Myroides fluvii]|uniref:hypothetical protein n=1 Tax=Myroides fluvii TaxID=2572594 RepID=UPI001E364957|nr:hypothetical protein [Myroides fluvii]